MLLKGDRGYDNLYTISAVVRCRSLGISSAVRFLIDTGASSTSICYKDAVRLGIDYKKLKKTEKEVYGIGGPVQSFSLPKSVLIFINADRRIHVGDLDNADVLKNKKNMDTNMVPPSLLGMDILYNYTIDFDGANAFLKLKQRGKSR